MTKKQQKTIKNFVSEIDKRLAEFDKTHALSASQIAEINKYKKIYELRDNPDPKSGSEQKDIWGEWRLGAK